MRAVLSFLALALPLALADHHANVNHRELAKRAKGDIEKRGDARWSFYATGLGACGGWNKDSDYIVALNQQTFGYTYPGKYCGKQITMTYNGKTTTATIVDSCSGCPSPKGLDLSPGLFSFFASQDEGIIYGDWWFSDGSGGGGDPPPATTKKTTTKHTTTSTKTTPTYTPPTTTYTPPTTTTTKSSTTKSSTTTTKSSTTTTSSTTSKTSEAPTSSASSNSLAAASGTVSSTSSADPENLYTFAQVMLDLTGVVVAGANAE